MQITSQYYILLSVVSIFIFYLLNRKYRVFFLALLSAAFIVTYSYILLIYVFGFTLINYVIGLKMPDSNSRKTLYITGIVFNVLQLVLLKYVTFTINPLFRLLHVDLDLTIISRVIIPLGVSYFSLQGIGYLINLKMGWEKPERNFPDFLLYIIFFPKFISGPIERSNHFLPQLKEGKSFDVERVSSGLRVVLIGLFKKVAIANQLAPYVLDAFRDIQSTEPWSLWILFFLLPLYLYFDFSGYTDIAIGIARTFGIDLLPNFNTPFFAHNVTTFWKRFHISLASWFGDYIFRQTVFKRRKWGVYASVYAVFITWTLFGIWHGAGWNFMALGFLQALLINYEFFTRKSRYKFFSRLPGSVNIWTGRIFTYIFYCISLVFFFAPDLESVFAYFGRLAEVRGMLYMDDMSTKPFMLLIYIPLFLFLEYLQNDRKKTYMKLEKFWLGSSTRSRIFRWTTYSVIITIIYIVGLKAEQFVYANF